MSKSCPLEGRNIQVLFQQNFRVYLISSQRVIYYVYCTVVYLYSKCNLRVGREKVCECGYTCLFLLIIYIL